MACFALGAAVARYGASESRLLQKLGTAFFLPQAIGWAGSTGLVVLVMAAW